LNDLDITCSRILLFTNTTGQDDVVHEVTGNTNIIHHCERRSTIPL
jgi:hypothetical protein